MIDSAGAQNERTRLTLVRLLLHRLHRSLNLQGFSDPGLTSLENLFGPRWTLSHYALHGVKYFLTSGDLLPLSPARLVPAVELILYDFPHHISLVAENFVHVPASVH